MSAIALIHARLRVVTAGPLRRAEGTLRILRKFPGWRHAQFQPRSEMEAARDRRVGSRVEHAARYVPSYRDLFRSSEVEAGDIELPAQPGGKFRHLVPLHGD